METSINQVFNLMDTNGRRSDVINALSIYLSFLDEKSKDENYKWAAFPESLVQFEFYKNAITQSPDVFENHPNYDFIVDKLREELSEYYKGNKEPLKKALQDKKLQKTFDSHIEARARHFSSNLCKLGLASSKRIVTPAGSAFLGKSFKKDPIESLLPLTNTNIVILRQLMKLKIFSKGANGERQFYSPFYAAVFLLLQNKITIEEQTFRTIIQSLNPYYKDIDIENILSLYVKDCGNIKELYFDIPEPFKQKDLIPLDSFKEFIKNRKSGKVEDVYYEFYVALYNFNQNRNEENFDLLINVLKSDSKKDKLKKAFGFGQNVFADMDSLYSYGINSFMLSNGDNELLSSDSFNEKFFERYMQSKYCDSAREYSDTTKRMLSATGLFRFDKPLPVLAYKEILSTVFSLDEVKKRIFGTMSEEEYQEYEGSDSVGCVFYSDMSMTEILDFDSKYINQTIDRIEKVYGAQREELIGKIKDKANSDFLQHINSKYTRDKVLEILKLFSNRSNDKIIKMMVNPEASVPTIYEFITAIAWYYLSEKQMNLFDSMNLTLNAEYEPILHAGGGDGDIIAKYKDIVVMLEVTLMDKNSQKRGEMEPVLRHSTNLRAKYSDKDTLTFFIADELDPNTVITWRLAVLTPRQASNSKMVDHIKIMSFTNDELCSFIEKGVTSRKIVEATNEGFATGNFNPGWRENIVSHILA